MQTITFINPLGGCGKTTSAWALGIGLQSRGYKVLLVDLDPQANLCYVTDKSLKHLAPNLYHVFKGNADIEQVIHTLKPGLDIIVGGQELFHAETEFTQQDREYMLKTQLEHAQTAYDYCIIDIAPHLDVLATNALTASNSIVIPMQDEEYVLNVMNILKPFIDTIVKSFNPQLKIAGILVVSFTSKPDFAQDVLLKMDNLAQNLGTKVFQTKIHVVIGENEKSINDYSDFVSEILEQTAN